MEPQEVAKPNPLTDVDSLPWVTRHTGICTRISRTRSQSLDALLNGHLAFIPVQIDNGEVGLVTSPTPVTWFIARWPQRDLNPCYRLERFARQDLGASWRRRN